MADLSISVGDNLNVMGPAATNKWNDFNWGESFWGASVDPQFHLMKYLFETVSMSDELAKELGKYLADSLPAFADDTNTITVDDGSGYFYVFVDNVIDADNRSEEVWTASDGGSASWSEVSDPSTTWEEA